MVQRVGQLIIRPLLDIIPIIALGLIAYGALTLVDPRQQTRLVAVALINASMSSRLVMAIASFLLSPQTADLRLWSITDESANYIHQWTKRLSVIAI